MDNRPGGRGSTLLYYLIYGLCSNFAHCPSNVIHSIFISNLGSVPRPHITSVAPNVPHSPLVGGDPQSPLSSSVTVLGWVPRGASSPCTSNTSSGDFQIQGRNGAC